MSRSLASDFPAAWQVAPTNILERWRPGSTEPADRIILALAIAQETLWYNLSSTWREEFRLDVDVGRNMAAAALITLRSVGGLHSYVIAHARTDTRASRMHVPIDRLGGRVSTGWAPELGPVRGPVAGMIVAPHISLSGRRRIVEAGLGYSTASGHMYLKVGRPKLAIEMHG